MKECVAGRVKGGTIRTIGADRLLGWLIMAAPTNRSCDRHRYDGWQSAEPVGGDIRRRGGGRGRLLGFAGWPSMDSLTAGCTRESLLPPMSSQLAHKSWLPVKNNTLRENKLRGKFTGKRGSGESVSESGIL